MLAVLFKSIIFVSALFPAVLAANAQTADAESAFPGRRDTRRDEPRTVAEMLTKQRLIREKKDHEELLKRGEEAARLSSQLENAFGQNNGFSRDDKLRLESLERVVTKIRKELGGDDDGEKDEEIEKELNPSTLKEALIKLEATASTLFDELKKTTRFTISAAAIQTSNAVLRLVRFVQLRK